MALFGNPNAYLGIDVGTSSLKIVELIARKRRIEVTAYAQAAIENPLVNESNGPESIQEVANVVQAMIEQSGATSDQVVVALPASAVFTSVIELPVMSDEEMKKAVEFAARDIVPTDLDDVVLGYSTIGHKPQLAIEQPAGSPVSETQTVQAEAGAAMTKEGNVPVFITAAPKFLVDRYVQLVGKLGLRLVALELETFPLVRSLLPSETASGMIVDIGDRATTYHVIDQGTPRVSFTIEFGGLSISEEMARSLSISVEEAEELKRQTGAGTNAPPVQRAAIEKAITEQTTTAKELLGRYMEQEGREIKNTVLIGGGANLLGLVDVWQQAVGHKVSVGNPWRGLAYPAQLESRLRYLGPVYGVAVGLALRNFTSVADENAEV